MVCSISSLQKYVNRPSPPRPANETGCRGKMLVGNDGNMWISQSDKNGTYKWKPAHHKIASSPRRKTSRRRKTSSRKKTSRRRKSSPRRKTSRK